MNWLNRMAQASYGSYLAAMVLAGFLVGRGADAVVHTLPYLTIAGTGLGLIGGLHRLAQLFSQPAVLPPKDQA